MVPKYGDLQNVNLLNWCKDMHVKDIYVLG